MPVCKRMTQPTILHLAVSFFTDALLLLPNVKIRKIRYVLPGTIFVVLRLSIVKFIFRLFGYLCKSLNGCSIFSSIFVVVVMIWFTLITQIMIIGAILNTSYQGCHEKEFETRHKQLTTRLIKIKRSSNETSFCVILLHFAIKCSIILFKEAI